MGEVYAAIQMAQCSVTTESKVFKYVMASEPETPDIVNRSWQVCQICHAL
jgi:hypothetical protein